MRLLMLCSALLTICCGGGGGGAVDSGSVTTGTDGGSAGDAGTTRYCTKPTGGTYGFTLSGSGSALYLVGNDGWTVKIGDLVVGPNATPIAIEAVSQHGASLVGTAGEFMYDIPKTANAAGRVVIEPRTSYTASTSFTTFNYFDISTFVGAQNRDVSCGTSSGGTFLLGLGSTLPCTAITGIRGTCQPQNNGNYQVKAVVTCGSASRYVQMSQLNMVPIQNEISGEIAGKFRGLTSDSRTTDGTGKIYSISKDGAAKLLDLKLCVDELIDNPFNGSVIALSEIVD